MHQQAQAQAMAARAAATAQRGQAFSALARVVSAAMERPTIGTMPEPHRPPAVGQPAGICCEHCRNVFTAQALRTHYASGCPALTAG